MFGESEEFRSHRLTEVERGISSLVFFLGFGIQDEGDAALRRHLETLLYKH